MILKTRKEEKVAGEEIEKTKAVAEAYGNGEIDRAVLTDQQVKAMEFNEHESMLTQLLRSFGITLRR